MSYPKAGRTWLRVMMGRALQVQHGLPEGVGIIELHRMAARHPGLPCIRSVHPGGPLSVPDAEVADDAVAGLARVPTTATMGPVVPDTPIILLVRDPRDVIVSWYHHRHGGRERPYQGSLAAFLDDPDEFANVLEFHDVWAEVVADARPPWPVLVVRYEDLHDDAAGQLRRCLEFIGVQVDDDVIDEAVRFGSFDNMRRLEEGDSLGSPKLRPVTPGDFSTYKTRRGQMGGYRDELSASQITELTRRMHNSRSADFGYR